MKAEDIVTAKQGTVELRGGGRPGVRARRLEGAGRGDRRRQRRRPTPRLAVAGEDGRALKRPATIGVLSVAPRAPARAVATVGRGRRDPGKGVAGTTRSKPAGPAATNLDCDFVAEADPDAVAQRLPGTLSEAAGVRAVARTRSISMIGDLSTAEGLPHRLRAALGETLHLFEWDHAACTT